MGVITDKLDAEWSEYKENEAMFAVRAIIQEFYYALERVISDGNDKYPTGDAQFDNYVQPIVTELVSFKNQLDNNYAEFINWRQP